MIANVPIKVDWADFNREKRQKKVRPSGRLSYFAPQFIRLV